MTTQPHIKTLTVGSIFSGIGGLDIGFERAGFRTLWQCEQDAFCRKVLKKHWPEVPCYEDVRHIHSSSYLDSLVTTWYLPLSGSSYTVEEEEMAGKLRKLTPEQAEECVRMYEAGLSLQPIAEYFNVSRQGMWSLLKRRTTMRSKKRYGKDNHFHRGGSVADDQAQNLVEVALNQGLLERPSTCQACGKEPGRMKDGRSKIQAHHDDYNKPLEVRWLCQKCPHAWHKSNSPTPKKTMKEAADVDLLIGGFP